MKLNSMLRSEIVKMVRKCYETKNLHLMIILTDGTTVCGRLPLWKELGQVIKALPSRNNVKRKSYLEMEHNQVGKEYSIAVPLDEIAGISFLKFSQHFEEKKFGPPQYGQRLVGSAYEKLFEDFFGKASVRRFKIEKIHIMYELAAHRPIKWGKISFGAETPLYCDWEFLSRTSGGLSSLGAGFVVSFSAGWKKSLWSSFSKKVSRTNTKLDEICSRQEATVSGFARFLEFHDSARSKNETTGFLEMEGEKWCCAIISDKEVKSKRQIRKVSWALAYFKDTSFMFPKNLWENFSQEIRIYGEVIPVKLKTEFGTQECFIKARAAVYMKPI